MLDILTYLLLLIDDFMYFPVLIIVMMLSGLYFTFRTKGVQIRLLPESVRIIREPSDDENSVFSLQAMLVSTASRVGTGNIIGVSTAICIGGPGACFWMWLLCIIGASSAFIFKIYFVFFTCHFITNNIIIVFLLFKPYIMS